MNKHPTSVIPPRVMETELDAFRCTHLSPDSILHRLEESVQVLYRLGIGIGKSTAVDGLLCHPATYERFGTIIYVAPSWNILNERPIIAKQQDCPVPWTVLKPRPIERCSRFADPWDELALCNCSAYGKATLCRECQNENKYDEACFWPGQFKTLPEYRLIFSTEQQLVLNRSLVALLKMKTTTGRVLVILDEARMLDVSFEISLKPKYLKRYRDILTRSHRASKVFNKWCIGIDRLLSEPQGALHDIGAEFPPVLNKAAYRIQKEGIRQYSRGFQYLGYDLSLFPFSPWETRWKDSAGKIHFIARPYLNCHLLVLSAHLTAAYTGHRLGKGAIESPFERTKFFHSQTRILNLRNRMGADAYFWKNRPQILDTFAVLIFRNIMDDRSTLLISRKKSKNDCAVYLKERLSGWGVDIVCVTENYDQLPDPPDPKVIPVIHYGILGVNDFTHYQTAYCLNSYYVSTDELNRQVQESEPEQFRVKLTIETGPEMMRKVAIADDGIKDPERISLGEIYLRKLEVDPVIQAAGRVRFLTHAREVIFFQMHDLTRDVGVCTVVKSLAELREQMNIPAAKELDAWAHGMLAEKLMAEGMSAEEAGKHLGISRRTVFRRLEAAQSAKNTINIYIRKFGTLAPKNGQKMGQL